MNYRITIAYDGTEYCGWQRQAGQPTIQAALEEALEKLEGVRVVAHGAGRTDAGVHAEGQAASFRLTREWRGDALRRALNGNLPPDIRVLDAAPAADGFHARFDAKSKTYRYQVYEAEVMDPLRQRYAWHVARALDLDRLREEAGALVGTHDFVAFTTADCEVQTTVRTVTEARIERSGALLTFWFSGDGFLRYQVRTMVGALIEANHGRLRAGSMAALMESRDRRLAGAPAPASGLTLMKVEY